MQLEDVGIHAVFCSKLPEYTVSAQKEALSRSAERTNGTDRANRDTGQSPDSLPAVRDRLSRNCWCVGLGRGGQTNLPTSIPV